MIAIDTNNDASTYSANPTEASFLQAIVAGDGASTRPVYADWLEERGHELHAEYVRTQCELLAAADLATFDERASHLAILATGLDRRWRELLDCPLIQERVAGRRVGWLAFSFAAPRPPSAWELPEQLRYLEKLAPRKPPEPWVMAPRGGWR